MKQKIKDKNMKTIIITLLLSMSFYAQNLSLTKNIELGTNCGNGQHSVFEYQDVNLNGHTITLRNASLKVKGNLNGGGEIKECGNSSNSSLCVDGLIQNNPILNRLSCRLSNNEFEFTQDNYGLNYKVYDITGREIFKGITSSNTLEQLPRNQVLIIKVEGFVAKKLILKNYEKNISSL